jgi:hypothetical protein
VYYDLYINLVNIMKYEIEKFTYGIGSGLSETEAKENFVKFYKEYGLLTLRVGLFALMVSSTKVSADTPPFDLAENYCVPAPALTQRASSDNGINGYY